MDRNTMTTSTYYQNYTLDIVDDKKIKSGDYFESSLQLVPTIRDRINYLQISATGSLYKDVKRYYFIFDLSNIDKLPFDLINPIRGEVIIKCNIVQTSGIKYTFDKEKKILTITVKPGFVLKKDTEFAMKLNIDIQESSNDTQIIPFSDAGWYYNFGGQKDFPIVEVISAATSSPEILQMNLCNWYGDAWYGGNLSYKEKLGFGEYTIYIRPSPCLNNLTTAFYLNRPPQNPGQPQPGFQDSMQEVDFEITMFNNDCTKTTGILNVLPTTNIWYNGIQTVINPVKKEDGSCKTEEETVQEFPNINIDYSKNPTGNESQINNYSGSLKFTISWFVDYILWTIQSQENDIVFQRYINWDAQKDVIISGDTIIDNGEIQGDDQWNSYKENYQDENSMVPFVSVIASNDWMDCGSSDTPDDGPYSCPGGEGGYQSSYFQGLTFNPNKTIQPPNIQNVME